MSPEFRERENPLTDEEKKRMQEEMKGLSPEELDKVSSELLGEEPIEPSKGSGQTKKPGSHSSGRHK